jgi:hypothetical protein
MNTPTSIIEQVQRRIDAAGKGGGMVRRVRGKVMWVNTIRRGACVLAMPVVLTVGVGVRSDHDISTAEATVAPAGIVVPTTATLSRDPNPDGWNEDMALVTSRARFKAH